MLEALQEQRDLIRSLELDEDTLRLLREARELRDRLIVEAVAEARTPWKLVAESAGVSNAWISKVIKR